MSKHLERVLGLADEVPDEDLTIESYLGETGDSLDAPTENPVADAFASNTEMADEYENPVHESGPEDPTDLADDAEFDPSDDMSGFDDGGSVAPPSEGEEEPITDDMRQALTDKFIENARTRLLNSQKLQDRANLLNMGTEEDNDAGQ